VRLLIVDDEPVIRHGLLKMAERYEPAFTDIQTADNGASALDKIHAEQPDIVITDIRMPQLNGVQLCEEIHEQHPDIMTIVISGYSEFEYAQRCIAYGVKYYLLKPITKQDLHNVFDHLVKQPHLPYLMVSRYVEWIDRMEQCIWSLQMDALDELCLSWHDYCSSANLSRDQLKELLNDCHSMLVKRLQSRGYSPPSPVSDFRADSRSQLLDDFANGLKKLAEGLLSTRQGNFKDPMEVAKAYIDSRLSEEISLNQVAAMVGLTPTYFSALFKRITHETFVQYRIHQRMNKAKELLAVPHLRIVDVASDVGYEDYPHFTKTFKKIIGVSPSEYRAGLGIK